MKANPKIPIGVPLGAFVAYRNRYSHREGEDYLGMLVEVTDWNWTVYWLKGPPGWCGKYDTRAMDDVSLLYTWLEAAKEMGYR